VLPALTGGEKLVLHVKTVGVPKLRKLHTFTPWGNGVQFDVHNADVHTAYRGLVTRVFYSKDEFGNWLSRPKQVQYQVVKRLLRHVKKQFFKVVHYASPITPEQFVNHYRGRKRKIYQRALESLLIRDIQIIDSYLSTFVKAEKLNTTAKGDPDNHDPRVIQPRTPRYNLMLGCFIKPIEHLIYRAIDEMCGGPTVMKGLNADQRGAAIADAWHSFRNPVAVGGDAHRFDKHVNVGCLRFEHLIYNIMHGFDPVLVRLLRWQLRQHGFVYCADGTIRYVVDGRRCSGDMNTALGNVLLMCFISFAYILNHQLHVRLIDDGDDCLFICEEETLGALTGLVDWYDQFGMVLALEQPVRQLEHVEFCQSHPVQVNPGIWRMVRDPRIVLDKDQISVKPIQNRHDYDFYRKAISDCGLALAGDLPVFYEFYQMLGRGAVVKRNRDQHYETGMQFLAHGMEKKYSPPSITARISFAFAFDITPDEQQSYEAVYRDLHPEWTSPQHVQSFTELISVTS
jgi:hypothetical protein